MLTGWGRHALATLRRRLEATGRGSPVCSAPGTSASVALRQPARGDARRARRRRRGAGRRGDGNPGCCPAIASSPTVSFHPDVGDAARRGARRRGTTSPVSTTGSAPAVPTPRRPATGGEASLLDRRPSGARVGGPLPGARRWLLRRRRHLRPRLDGGGRRAVPRHLPHRHRPDRGGGAGGRAPARARLPHPWLLPGAVLSVLGLLLVGLLRVESPPPCPSPPWSSSSTPPSSA